MKPPIVWIASFPKSGSTWLRVLIANLKASAAEPVDINRLPDLTGIASNRGPLDHLTLLETGLLTHEESAILRPRLYEALAAEWAGRIHFVKVHDAYTMTAKGEPLMGRGVARGAIYIVRDPRDVAVSLAFSESITIDQSIAMLSPQSSLCGELDRQNSQLRQRLLGWSGHVTSWLEQTDLPMHLIRYENLQQAPAHTFAEAMRFAGLDAASADVDSAVRHSDFGELRRQEELHSFIERTSRTSPFFRQGKSGGWRNLMTKDQAQRIGAIHGDVMLRLGYR